MRIAFLWDGVKTHYGKRFEDGLYLALKRLEVNNGIGYFEPTDSYHIDLFKPDRILFWGALSEPCVERVIQYPYKKAICFAGGAIEAGNVGGWDLFFTESEINEKELKQFNQPFKRAFGINEKIFVPHKTKKKYDAIFWGAFAKWKRPELFAEAVKDNGIAIGQHQDHEKECYQVCEEMRVDVRDELPRRELVNYINQSRVAVNPSNFWGGGQRMTLEAMACDIPVVVMDDSPKNKEYVDESGFGLIVEPNCDNIKTAINLLKNKKINSRKYIESKWTSKHYADNLIKGLKAI